jgi:hypothetical protein
VLGVGWSGVSSGGVALLSVGQALPKSNLKFIGVCVDELSGASLERDRASGDTDRRNPDDAGESNPLPDTH